MKRILACVDFSEVTDDVVSQTKTLALLSDAEVRLLHVGAPNPDFVGFEAGPDVVRQNVAHALRDEHRRLEELAESLRRESVRATPLMVQGPTVRTIVEHVQRFGADLVVIGSHGHGALFDLLVGSVTQGVLRESPVPALVVPSPKRRAPKSQ
jgi:nucleotide-binding universal stress UspA family protein